MNSLPAVTQFFLGLGALLVLLWPLIRDWQSRWEEPETREEFNRKEAVLDALSDLEYEHETGKINDSDYRRLRDVYVQQAVELLDEEDRARLEQAESADAADPGAEDELEEAIRRARENL